MNDFELIQRAQLIDPDYRPTKKDCVWAKASETTKGRLVIERTLSNGVTYDETVEIMLAPDTKTYLAVVLMEAVVGAAGGVDLSFEITYTNVNGAARTPFEGGEIANETVIPLDGANQTSAFCRPFRPISGTAISFHYVTDGPLLADVDVIMDVAIQEL